MALHYKHEDPLSSMGILVFMMLLVMHSCKKADPDDVFRYRQNEDYSVWVASPWQRVLRDDPPRSLYKVELNAAINEYAPFRIIISTGTLVIDNVSVICSDLTGPGKISSTNINLYRASYIRIDKPSYRTSNPFGWYPDALIPCNSLYSTDARRSGPFSTGRNTDIWCDLYVPHGTLPGQYAGKISVVSGKFTLAEIPVTLTVSGFELPAKISMRSSFGGLYSDALNMLNLQPGSAEALHMTELFNKELLSHRLVPATPSNVWPAWNETTGITDNGASERMRKIVEQENFNSLNIPFRYRTDSVKCASFMADIAAWLKGLGYLDMAYVYMLDEPNDAEEYNTVRKEASFIHAGDPEIRRMCTEQTRSSNPAWGDLYGSVDIWCPLWGLWDETTAIQRLEQGEELWSYTALCQGANGTPWWQIDVDPLNFRVPAWLSWRFNITGLLYWSSTYWSSQTSLAGVWERPLFRNMFWGEGILLYPGAPQGINGFIPSIRLKLIRESMEDYEYMVLAAKLGKQSDVDAIVRQIATGFQNWSHDPASYENARQSLARLIAN